MRVIEWLNTNQGSIIALLTLIYVATTVMILISNRKSVLAANVANKQQLALQLMDRRLNAYYQLISWTSIANSLFIDNFPLGTATDLYQSMLYSSSKSIEVQELTNTMEKLNIQLTDPHITNIIRSQVQAILEQKSAERMFLRLKELVLERNLIDQIEILFPSIDYAPVKSFCDIFFSTFLLTNKENIDSLKLKYKNITTEGNSIVDSIWNKIKEM